MRKLLPTLLLLAFFSCTQDEFENENVKISKQDGYYKVTIDYSTNIDMYETGKRLGQGMTAVIPKYEEIYDSYIENIASKSAYKYYIYRAQQLYENLDTDFKNELDGIASVFSGTEDKRGDNKLSKNEFYFINFLPDLSLRKIACSYLGIEKDISATKKVLFSRNLEWYPGDDNQILKVQGIKEFIYNDTRIVNIAPLGHMGILTGIKDNGLSVSILDASVPTQTAITSEYPYTFNLRKALINSSTKLDIYENTKNINYVMSYLIGTSDNDGTVVIENHIVGGITKSLLRSNKSQLHDRAKWDISGAIPAVNSFLLKGHINNHNDKDNIKRLSIMNDKLKKLDNDITENDLMDIASTKLIENGEVQYDGSMFKYDTIYSTTYSPGDNYINLYLKNQKIYDTPKKADFKKVVIF